MSDKIVFPVKAEYLPLGSKVWFVTDASRKTVCQISPVESEEKARLVAYILNSWAGFSDKAEEDYLKGKGAFEINE